MITKNSDISLSKLTLADAPFIFELMNSESWKKYIGDKNIDSLKKAENHIENVYLKCYKDHEFGFYKITLNHQPSQHIGVTGFIKRDELKFPEVGFAFLPDYQNKGYGYQSTKLALDYGLKTFKFKTLLAITQPNNQGSIKLLQKIGLTYQKRIFPFDDGKELLLFAKNY
ncbi:MAG: hypothetical protein BM564_06330 [Bacteroidetes bacterium MedPE-SWsnd-G2]|nr:MAG: hypothetical protein BM564_06330 [Bacteroidetes bacterium MedPE-SWsnd-G2]